jgi:hypothetical protein
VFVLRSVKRSWQQVGGARRGLGSNYVLERIADYPINQIEDLLPWNLLAKIPELRIAA